MSFNGLIIVILVCFCISFWYLRGFLYGIKRYQLNNSAYKKRKLKETFKEWLLYSRYKEEIPKSLRLFYYAICITHFVGVFICLILYIVKASVNIGRIIAKCIFYFDGVWIILIGLLFWSPGPDYAYERWITKKRGQRKRKK